MCIEMCLLKYDAPKNRAILMFVWKNGHWMLTLITTLYDVFTCAHFMLRTWPISFYWAQLKNVLLISNRFSLSDLLVKNLENSTFVWRCPTRVESIKIQKPSIKAKRLKYDKNPWFRNISVRKTIFFHPS